MCIAILILICLLWPWLFARGVLEPISGLSATQDHSFVLIVLIILYSLKVVLVYMYCLPTAVIWVRHSTGVLLRTICSTFRLHVISVDYLTQLSWFCHHIPIWIRGLVEAELHLNHILIFINLLYFILSLAENLLSVVLLQLLPTIVKWFHTELLQSSGFSAHIGPGHKLNSIFIFLEVLWRQLSGLPRACASLEEIGFNMIDLIEHLYLFWLIEIAGGWLLQITPPSYLLSDYLSIWLL